MAEAAKVKYVSKDPSDLVPLQLQDFIEDRRSYASWRLRLLVPLIVQAAIDAALRAVQPDEIMPGRC
ncbi:MAG: hypothetical protein DME53_13715 [Verrucomicrobia bacterium]|nr:MAG: hypothetical protein DME53_13715 [Verrucomicrobiota bacterium]